MLVSTYNNHSLEDTLIVMLQPDDFDYPVHESKGAITKISNEATGEVVGFNFFQASNLLDLKEDGPVILTAAQVECLNDALKAEGFDFELEANPSPKFVVGFVKTCKPHEDSDHLSITQVEVDADETLQIVCGAPNIAQGQKVVVAKVGAIMPSGMIIWPGELRGVDSMGMICSARELGLENDEGQKGIMELSDDYEVGAPFNF